MHSTRRWSMSLAALLVVALGVGTAVAQNYSTSGEVLTGKILDPLSAADGGVSEVATNTAAHSVGTTPLEAVTDDVPTADRTRAKTQVFGLTNLGSGNLCAEDVARDLDGGVGVDCSTTCAAQSFTCDDTTDGGVYLRANEVIPASQSMPLLVDGDRCLCVVGPDGGVEFNARRVIR